MSDLAKELVKKWKNEVDRAKAANGGGDREGVNANGDHEISAYVSQYSMCVLLFCFIDDDLLAVRRASIAESVGTPPPKTPTTPTVGDGKEVARSAKLDGLKVDTTDDKTRNKCIELIYDSLCVGSTARACSVAFPACFRPLIL